jgi:hypothetical protein
MPAFPRFYSRRSRCKRQSIAECDDGRRTFDEENGARAEYARSSQLVAYTNEGRSACDDAIEIGVGALKKKCSCHEAFGATLQ